MYIYNYINMLDLNNDYFSIWEHENKVGKHDQLCKGLKAPPSKLHKGHYKLNLLE